MINKIETPIKLNMIIFKGYYKSFSLNFLENSRHFFTNKFDQESKNLTIITLFSLN